MLVVNVICPRNVFLVPSVVSCLVSADQQNCCAARIERIRNYKELQAKMNPADVAENKQRVREELQRMALDELRNAKQLTQVDMAELLDVPQSSISRIEQRADMYLSTLRNYVQAMGGVLQIQAVFPEGGAVIISRFGE
jgi:DNA-binding XRE family transcriptional regulator